MLAEGYTVEEAGGKYTVKMNAVARIGETQYPTLAKAIAAAKEGDTVQLLETIDLGNTYQAINKGYGITIDLNGYEIKGSYAGATVVVWSDLTVIDTSEAGTG